MISSTSYATKQFSAELATKKRKTEDGNVEPRMRKKAATARTADTEMAVAADSCSMFKRGCAPPNVISLGGDCFVTYSLFMGQTRIHIRKYVCLEGYFRPTREGVCVNPGVWLSFCERANEIAENPKVSPVIVENDLCVSRQNIDDEVVFAFQRIYQRKNLSYVFLPQFVKINQDQFKTLRMHIPDIINEVKNGLIRYDLFDAIQKELSAIKQNTQYNEFENFVGHRELQNSLGMCLLKALSPKIDEFLDYSDFYDYDATHVMHDCMNGRVIKFDTYFERALCNIDMLAVAKDFVKKYIKHDIDTVFAEFFDVADIKDMIVFIQSKYAGDKDCDFTDLRISE